MAAQMLSGKGFSQVINLAGGIKAWNGEKAFFGEEKGLELFDGSESPEQTLVVAYALEEGLREFYLSMIEKVKEDAVKNLFEKLSAIEEIHQDRIFEQYLQASGVEESREDFVSRLVVPAVEGGMTTDEYIAFFNPDLGSPEGVIELAMSIEAQALDLYSRASERADSEAGRNFLAQIAGEEQAHLKQLATLMDSVVAERR